MKSLTTAGSAPGFRLAIRYLDNCSWIVLELFGVVSVTNTYCNKLKIMQSADQYIKEIFVLKLTFFRRGSGGNPKMYSTTDKKDPEPTEYFIQINADYTSICGYHRATTSKRTVFRQSRRTNTP